MERRPVRRGSERLTRAALRAAPWAGMAAFAALWWTARGRASAKPPGGDLPGAEPAADAQELAPEALVALYGANEPGRGRLAHAPPQIPAQGWRDVLWRTWKEIGRDRLSATAGGVTFFVLLAIFPALGAFVSLWGLFADVGAVSRQLGDLAAFVPASALGLVAEQMIRLATARQETLSFAFGLSLLLSLWSANAGMGALFDGLNVVYEEREKRNFLVRRVMTFGFTCAALLFVTAVTAVLVAVPLALRTLGLGDTLLVPLRWLLVLVLAAVGFGVMYRFGPSRQRARWRWVRPGAFLAAAAWLGGSLAFSWYINHVAHYDATYGPLGAVVGFMSWIWLSVMIVLLGAELNAELEHQTAQDTTTGAPLPIGLRGAAMADSVGPAVIGVRKEAAQVWAMLERQARRVRRRGG
jgi:membrane protein